VDFFDQLRGPETPVSEITCPKYRPLPGTARCQHYLANGSCNLPDELMCVEWLKKNAHLHQVHASLPVAPDARVLPAGAPVPPGSPRSGAAVGPPARPEPPLGVLEPPERPAGFQGPETVTWASPVAPGDVEALARVAGEVRLQDLMHGDVFLVSARTGQDRQELTYHEASLLRYIVDLFPGTVLVELRRPESKPEVQS
jgi:hypothetical protein